MGNLADWVARAFALVGSGLLLVGGLFGAITVSAVVDGRTFQAVPTLAVLWIIGSGVAHVFAASPDASPRTRWLVLASQLPIVAALTAASWPLRPEDLVLVGITLSIPVMLGLGLGLVRAHGRRAG